MSLAVRIIPRIDIKGPNVVKGVNLEGLRVVGKPEAFAEYYYAQGADELIFQDVVASLYGRNSLYPIIQKVAKKLSIPLTVGGGVRSLEDIKEILRAGADKVSINTAAFKDPTLITRASKAFGASTIVIGIEAIRQPNQQYLAYFDNGRNNSGKDVIEWAKEVEELGAGEILLTSVDREGMGKGADIDLIKKVSQAVTIPVIAHGGFGDVQHVADVLSLEKVNAVAISSMFHYEAITQMSQSGDYRDEGNIDFLKSNRSSSFVKSVSIKNLKKSLLEKGFCCRE